MLIHQLEMLEIQEEIDNEDDDEDLEILEEEESNVTPKAPENNKENQKLPINYKNFIKNQNGGDPLRKSQKFVITEFSTLRPVFR